MTNTAHHARRVGTPMPLASDDAATASAKFAAAGQPLPPKASDTVSRDTTPPILATENGGRERARCTLPNICNHNRIRRQLEQQLAQHFGGFTRYEMMGGWVSPEGDYMLEAGYVYEVAYEYRHDRRERAKAIFAWAGHAIGERWVNIELECFTAAHVQVHP